MNRRLLMAALALAAASAQPAPASAACKIAAAGGGLTLVVALNTEPGGHLRVDWGDGSSSESEVPAGARTTSLTHVYAAPGTYDVVADDTGPGGCGTELEAKIPYDSGDDAKSQEVLPPLGPPVPDDLAPAPAEAPDP
jgi:hypothetical protein